MINQRHYTRPPIWRRIVRTEVGFILALVAVIIILPAIGGLILEAIGYGYDPRIGQP